MNPLQHHNTPLHFAALEGHTTCVDHLIFTPGICVNMKNGVSRCMLLEYDLMIHVHVVCSHKAALNTQAAQKSC